MKYTSTIFQNTCGLATRNTRLFTRVIHKTRSSKHARVRIHVTSICIYFHQFPLNTFCKMLQYISMFTGGETIWRVFAYRYELSKLCWVLILLCSYRKHVHSRSWSGLENQNIHIHLHFLFVYVLHKYTLLQPYKITIIKKKKYIYISHSDPWLNQKRYNFRFWQVACSRTIQYVNQQNINIYEGEMEVTEGKWEREWGSIGEMLNYFHPILCLCKTKRNSLLGFTNNESPVLQKVRIGLFGPQECLGL